MLSKWTLAVRAEMPKDEFCWLYMSGDAIHEDILFCLTIPKHETAQGMFSVLRSYIDEKQTGLCPLVMNVSPSAIWTHCIIHREQLITIELNAELGDTVYCSR